MATLRQIHQLLTGDSAPLFNYLNNEVNRQEIVTAAIRELIPDMHEVMNRSKRPDKEVTVNTGQVDQDGNPIMTTKLVPISRAPLSVQRYITGQKASFASGSGIELKPTKEKSVLFDHVYRNWDENKTGFDLRDIFERIMGETQCAVIFHGTRGAEKFEDFRYKYKIISPTLGDTLQPFYDQDTGDLIAFGRGYQVGENNRYDLYIMNEQGYCEIHRFINNTPITVDVVDKDGKVIGVANEVIKTTYTKLPIIYGEQLFPECWDTRHIIREFENQFNDFLTQIGYSGDPILAITADESNKLPDFVAQGKALLLKGQGSKAEFVTPANATDSRELAFDKMEKYIFGLNRATLLDAKTMQELKAESGEAIRRMLTDIYSEAEDKQNGYLGKFVQRMLNWMVHEWRSLLGGIDKDLRVNARFIPKSFSGEKERIEVALLANGNKPVATWETSIGMAGIEDDVQKALETIKGEGSNVGDNTA